MIVLDEQLQGLGLEEAVARWYRGAVFVVKKLRPGMVIKDEAIPTLLRQLKQPTFVTIDCLDLLTHLLSPCQGWCTVLPAPRLGTPEVTMPTPQSTFGVYLPQDTVNYPLSQGCAICHLPSFCRIPPRTMPLLPPWGQR
jgi:hypothetical protein